MVVILLRSEVNEIVKVFAELCTHENSQTINLAICITVLKPCKVVVSTG